MHCSQRHRNEQPESSGDSHAGSVDPLG
jgi:hypothetical protein